MPVVNRRRAISFRTASSPKIQKMFLMQVDKKVV